MCGIWLVSSDSPSGLGGFRRVERQSHKWFLYDLYQFVAIALVSAWAPGLLTDCFFSGCLPRIPVQAGGRPVPQSVEVAGRQRSSHGRSGGGGATRRRAGGGD